MKLSMVVPLGGQGDVLRDHKRNLEWIKGYYGNLVDEWIIVEYKGSRAAALNEGAAAAAAKVGGAGLIGWMDADVYISRQALVSIKEEAALCKWDVLLPKDVCWNVKWEDLQTAIEDDLRRSKVGGNTCSGGLAFTTIDALWPAAFTGWGGEDDAMDHICYVLFGHRAKYGGHTLYHIEHCRDVLSVCSAENLRLLAECRRIRDRKEMIEWLQC